MRVNYSDHSKVVYARRRKYLTLERVRLSVQEPDTPIYKGYRNPVSGVDRWIAEKAFAEINKVIRVVYEIEYEGKILIVTAYPFTLERR